MKEGDRVKVVAPGEFEGYTGVITYIKQRSKGSRAYYWLIFDDHPWQRPGLTWSFTREELEKQ